MLENINYTHTERERESRVGAIEPDKEREMGRETETLPQKNCNRKSYLSCLKLSLFCKPSQSCETTYKKNKSELRDYLPENQIQLSHILSQWHRTVSQQERNGKQKRLEKYHIMVEIICALDYGSYDRIWLKKLDWCPTFKFVQLSMQTNHVPICKNGKNILHQYIRSTHCSHSLYNVHTGEYRGKRDKKNDNTQSQTDNHWCKKGIYIKLKLTWFWN